jgi:hypothetical protein
VESKIKFKRETILLRQKGLSYSEIQKRVPVSKSSLSLWLRTMQLKSYQENRLFEKQIIFSKLGSEAKHRQRLDKVKRLKSGAVKEIGKINKENLFLMGVMLYWAEGAKQRGSNISQGIEFSNSDPKMCKFFIKWLTFALGISRDRIHPLIYVHESQKRRVSEILDFWSALTGFSKDVFGKTYFTSTIYPRKKQRKENGNYYGQLKIKVRRSTDLNRQVAGWIEGICGKVERFDRRMESFKEIREKI